MTEDVKQNLEYANSVLADKMTHAMDADELKMLAEGVATTAKTIAEINDLEEKRQSDLEERNKSRFKESFKTWSEIGMNIAGGVVRGLALAAIIAFGLEQKHQETDNYVTTPKTNNLVIDGLKSIIKH